MRGIERPSDDVLLDWWETARDSAPLDRALDLLALFGEGPAEALADWPIGRRDRALLAVRSALIGPEIRATAACPACGTLTEIEFTASAVTVEDPPMTAISQEYGMRLQAVTTRDLAAALASPEPRLALAFRCTSTDAGSNPTHNDQAWTEARIAAAGQALQALDPQADIRLALECSDCSTPWSAPFHVEPFFWKEMQGWARRLFDEVDRLARVYGWAERDILALSPRRRQTYLELAGS